MDGSLSTLLAATYLGGGGYDIAYEPLIDAKGDVYVSGDTKSSDFPASAGTLQGGEDGFIVKFDGALTKVWEGEYIGGAGDDGLGALAVDPAGNVYAAGSSSYYTGGTRRGWVVKLGSVDLAITMTDAPDPATAGVSLVYTVQVSNNGTSDATQVVVTDNLPDHLTVDSVATGQGSCSVVNLVVSCALGTVAAGKSVVLDITGTPTEAGAFVNTASVAAATPDPDMANNMATATTSVITGPGSDGDLSLAITAAPDPVMVNSALVYTIQVTNNGNQAVAGVVVTDTLPQGLASVAANPSQGTCSVSAGTVSCSLGNLPGSNVASVAIQATPTQTGTLLNSATVAGTTMDPLPENNTAAVTTTVKDTGGGGGGPVDLALTVIDSPDPVDMNGILTYTGTVVNQGAETATGVAYTHDLDPSVQIQTVTPTQGNCNYGGGTVSCAFGTLTAGASVSVVIVVTPTKGGGISGVATVSAAEPDTNTENNTVEMETEVLEPEL